MGTVLAPNYANLFMDRFKTKALENWPIKPLLWIRFIYDNFCLWQHGLAQLSKFVKYLKEKHDTIKFTHEVSDSEKAFLDTTVKFDTDNILYTTLYEKPIDTHLCTSITPQHTMHPAK